MDTYGHLYDKRRREIADGMDTFLRGAAEHPLPYEQSRQSMLLTFSVLESIQQGRSLDAS